MRIISWNCQGGFYNQKYEKIIGLAPDIAIIQECNKPSKLPISVQYEDIIWQGNDKKGIGVMTFSSKYKISSLVVEYKFPWILPILVTGEENFVLVAVWTQDIPGFSYGKLLLSALKEYNHLFENKSVIIIGDFNIDQKYKPSYGGILFDEITELLEVSRIKSCYHHFNNEKFGEETTPTYFHNRKKQMPFHLDYCFATIDVLERAREFCIKDGEDWNEISDHFPLIIELTTHDKL